MKFAFLYFNHTPFYFAAKKNNQNILNHFLKQIRIKFDSFIFKGCCKLTKITIPSYIKKIGENAFEGCTSLNEIVFEDKSKLLFIGDYAFLNCSSLTRITIPPTVLLIGLCAFKGCTSLKQISLPSNAKLFEFVFYDCSEDLFINKYGNTEINQSNILLQTFISQLPFLNPPHDYIKHDKKESLLSYTKNVYKQITENTKLHFTDDEYFTNEIFEDLIDFFKIPFSVFILFPNGIKKSIMISYRDCADILYERINLITNFKNFRLFDKNKIIHNNNELLINYNITKNSWLHMAVRMQNG